MLLEESRDRELPDELVGVVDGDAPERVLLVRVAHDVERRRGLEARHHAEQAPARRRERVDRPAADGPAPERAELAVAGPERALRAERRRAARVIVAPEDRPR